MEDKYPLKLEHILLPIYGISKYSENKPELSKKGEKRYDRNLIVLSMLNGAYLFFGGVGLEALLN